MSAPGAPGRTLQIATSPHISAGNSVETIMWNVVAALLPVTAFAVWLFGLAALLTVLTALASCLAAEAFANRLTGRASTLQDGSVAITGLLYGLTLPPGLALWMVGVGGFIAVLVGKALFGGLGHNPMNPALVGRAVLQGTFPVAMTTWTPALAADRFLHLPSSSLAFPFATPTYDVVSAATPLSRWKFDQIPTPAPELFWGTVPGSVGETGAVLILAGGAWLALRKMLNWRIPVTILATVASLSGLLWAWDPTRFASPAFMLGAGGLLLGAVFMATDMVGSPLTQSGVVIYGAFIGVLVVVLRTWGGMPEGVMYAILLGNLVSPHIDTLVRDRVYGTRRGGR